MSESGSRALTVSYDGESWLAMDAAGNYITLDSASALLLPALPEGSQVGSLLLPVEHVLSRTFSLPLPNVRLIDQDVLAQELEECTAEDAQDWWLAWQAGRSENGVSGMMFGLPESVHEQIDGLDAWQQLQTLSVDIWGRLNAQLRDDFGGEPVAVFDVDASGVFFGVWHGNDSEGYWRGMRRLNWAGEALADGQWAALAENINRSLQSMGWQNMDAQKEDVQKEDIQNEDAQNEDVQNDGAQNDEAISSAIGRLPPDLYAALNLSSWQGTLVELADLSSRHHANLAIEWTAGLNFRHGRWHSRSGFGQLKPWYRSLGIAVGLVVIWALGMMWQNHQLDVQLAAAQQRVIASFHQGLPDEKVMIDALAQLRKAAGGARGGASAGQGNGANSWLRQVVGIQRAYQQIPWKIKLLSLEHGKIMMSGQVKDLQTMNKVREALQQETGVTVVVRDTDISGQQVQFRMAW